MAASRREAEAADWLIRLERDESDATKAAFEAWLAADPRNHAAFLRLEKTWRRMEGVSKLKPLDGHVDENVLDKFEERPPLFDLAEDSEEPEAGQREEAEEEEEEDEKPEKSKPQVHRNYWLAIAASIAILGIGVSAWIAVQRSEWKLYKTDLGGFQRVALRDGSTALLDTNTEIRVRLTQQRREIILVQGATLFTVVRDAHRPFDVHAGDTLVRAVGTAFSVRIRDDKEVDVIVTEGRVAINPPDDLLDSTLPENTPLPTLSTLSAGESGSVSGHKLKSVQKIGADEMSKKMAWTQGRLWFDRVTLAEAVKEFNRYNRRQLVIDDPAIAGLRIGGAFDATDLDSFVEALRSFGIRTTPPTSKTDDSISEIIRLVAAK